MAVPYERTLGLFLVALLRLVLRNVGSFLVTLGFPRRNVLVTRTVAAVLGDGRFGWKGGRRGCRGELEAVPDAK